MLSRERWVINKIRALGGYYTKGVEGGAELRSALNRADSLDQLRDLISRVFLQPADQLFPLAVDLIEIVVGELAPLLFDFAF